MGRTHAKVARGVGEETRPPGGGKKGPARGPREGPRSAGTAGARARPMGRSHPKVARGVGQEARPPGDGKKRKARGPREVAARLAAQRGSAKRMGRAHPQVAPAAGRSRQANQEARARKGRPEHGGQPAPQGGPGPSRGDSGVEGRDRADEEQLPAPTAAPIAPAQVTRKPRVRDTCYMLRPSGRQRTEVAAAGSCCSVKFDIVGVPDRRSRDAACRGAAWPPGPGKLPRRSVCPGHPQI